MKILNRVFLSILSILTLSGAWLLITHRQEVADWLELRTYLPTESIEALSERTTMSKNAKKLFYVSDPQLLNKTQFNQSCKVDEKSIVLGCYDGIGIYLYDISDTRLNGVEEVTAAHEMLHVAYGRLSDKEEEYVNGLLQKAIKKISDQRIKKLLDSYAEKDSSSLLNEAHSIIGTEVKDLEPELEAYYKRYFLNRQAVVNYSDTYEQVFLDINQQVEKMDADLSLRKAQIEQLENSLEQRSSKLNDWRNRLSLLESSGQYETYNNEVPLYNKEVNQYNFDLQTVKTLISEYNTLVAERNNLALQQNQLIQNLDSRATEL